MFHNVVGARCNRPGRSAGQSIFRRSTMQTWPLSLHLPTVRNTSAQQFWPGPTLAYACANCCFFASCYISRSYRPKHGEPRREALCERYLAQADVFSLAVGVGDQWIREIYDLRTEKPLRWDHGTNPGVHMFSFSMEPVSDHLSKFL